MATNVVCDETQWESNSFFGSATQPKFEHEKYAQNVYKKISTNCYC